MRTTAKGLIVWNLEDDDFDHDELAANWDKIDALLDTLDSEVTPGPKRIQTLPSLPTTDLFVGRLVYLSAADSGFQANTLMQYDGSRWQPVGTPEITPTVPTVGNFAGRVIMLSADDSGFDAWTMLRYDGSDWGGIGVANISAYSSGAGSTHINGVSTSGDLYFADSNQGIVIVDRTTGVKRRLYFDSGNLGFEVVT